MSDIEDVFDIEFNKWLWIEDKEEWIILRIYFYNFVSDDKE